MNKVSKIVVVGGGTAGLLAALSLRIKLPNIAITVIRSKELGVIGVGEGTLGGFNPFIFNYLGLDRGDFYQQVNPTWKLGIKFGWGSRGSFNYGFSPNCDWQWNDLPYANGFYCHDDFTHACQYASLMDADMAFVKQENGDPLIKDDAVFHLENKRFVDYLESQAVCRGILLLDKKIEGADCSESGIRQLHLHDGTKLSADLYIDSSGFRSMLLHQHLKEPFESYQSSLFCDRALIGSWQRTDEAIRPYTTSDTMNNGWSWRIDHEHHINRGYVYASSFVDREQAEREFRLKNPLLGDLNEIAFTPGKYRHSWVKNVVAIGNACGFVEPLEATSIGIICAQSKKLVEALQASHARPDHRVRQFYNAYSNELWESTRRFLSIHYKLNTLLDTSFWQACRNDTYTGDIVDNMIQFYQSYGPDIHMLRHFLPASDPFGADGYLTIMVGMKLAYDRSNVNISPESAHSWAQHQHYFKQQAEVNSVSVAQALDIIRQPDWRWF